MNMIEIERALRELRLSGMAQTLSTRLLQAQAAQEPFLQTFAAMLQDELDRRHTRLMERRYKRSGLVTDRRNGARDVRRNGASFWLLNRAPEGLRDGVILPLLRGWI